MRSVGYSFLTTILVAAFFGAQASPANAGAFTFYLNMKPGCYSYSSPTSATYPLEGAKYKTLFRVPCSSPHHLQVIYAGVIKAKSRTATEQEVLSHCKAEYRKHLGVSAPTTIRNDRPYLNYYWPDAGLERLKYSNKAICYLHAADKTYDNYVTMVEEY